MKSIALCPCATAEVIWSENYDLAVGLFQNLGNSANLLNLFCNTFQELVKSAWILEQASSYLV